jgi:hypothetical protein
MLDEATPKVPRHARQMRRISSEDRTPLPAVATRADYPTQLASHLKLGRKLRQSGRSAKPVAIIKSFVEPTRGEWTAKRKSTASYVTRENLTALRLFFEHRRETLVFTIAHRRIWRGKSEIFSEK